MVRISIRIDGKRIDRNAPSYTSYRESKKQASDMRKEKGSQMQPDEAEDAEKNEGKDTK